MLLIQAGENVTYIIFVIPMTYSICGKAHPLCGVKRTEGAECKYHVVIVHPFNTYTCVRNWKVRPKNWWEVGLRFTCDVESWPKR